MIGSLSGTVLSIGMETAIIDVQGVGYEIAGTSRFLSTLAVGDEVRCAIDTMVREDFIRLYAFPTDLERQWFRLLQSVQGVGAKAALAILHVLTPAALVDAVAVEDAAIVARAQGVGKKIATRIVTELQGKVPDVSAIPHPALSVAAASGDNGQPARPGMGKTGRQERGEEGSRGNAPPPPDISVSGASADVSIRADAVSALVNLGYEAHHAREAVKIASEAAPDATLAALIRLSLKSLALA